MIKNNKGQLSIFMGITLILVMGMLAFIINIGLFVKAKINLQNAVDAAAFSGAATQSRQLTNIAYLNWEMRNTYKEWMFKYYVLGQLGLVSEGGPPGKPYNLSNAKIATASSVNFLLRSTPVLGDDANKFFDRYNMPSICVHNNSSTNICPLYGLPGIPRFPAIGVAGISEIHEAFVNKLVDEKGENCSARTQINFLAAISWAYSSGIKDISGAPLIATSRPGAWTQALELGMRMRNLEMIVNRPPVEEPMSIDTVSALQSVGVNIGLNERPVKAYMSALRNLGGGKYKDQLDPSAASTQGRDELAASFRLTEIAPQAFNAPEKSLSGFLIPAGNLALQKYYLDLQAITVNYATLFTTFATAGNDFSSTVKSEATCIVSKSAIPVPGYLLGFVKNPSVLTYYAVKGEADFTGLFFPRNSDDQPASFKLTAYAAAKPFGGRIGPRLFHIDEANQAIKAREDQERKSTAYIAGLDMTFEANGAFKPGMPIPSSQDFWAKSGVVLGGIPEAAKGVGFGIPNILYDYESDAELSTHGLAGTDPIMVVKQALSAETPGINDNKGLYGGFQFRSIKKALGTANPGSAMTSEQVIMALVRARRVTKYDAFNYLIPDYRQVSGTSNVPPLLNRLKAVEGDSTGKAFYYSIFAPLIGPDLIYINSDIVKTIVLDFRSANSDAIEKYLNSLKDVAAAIFALPSQGGSSVNAQAAQSIHINSGSRASETTFPPMSGDDLTSPNCPKDMASKFNHFFNKSYTACGIVPLELLISEYIEKQTQGSGNMFYINTYYNDLDPEEVMTAYQPGVRQGVQPGVDAIAAHPLNLSTPGIATYSTRRNFYSTKFVHLAKLMTGVSGTSSAADYLRESPLRESDLKSPDDLLSIGLKNPINAVTSGMNNPYFLDF